MATASPSPSPRSPRATRRELLLLGTGAAALGCTAPRSSAAPADELFRHLEDQRSSESPITADERAARRVRLGKLLAVAGIDAWFCEAGATMDFLSGVAWGHSERVFGLVVQADGTHFWICPAFEAEKARLRTAAEAGGELVTWDEHEYARAAFARAAAARGLGRWAVDPGTRYLAVLELEAADAKLRIESGAPVLGALRGIKDAHELQLLRRANELTQQGILAAAEHVRPGMCGAEIGDLMRRAQERLGLRDVWVLALPGTAAAYPHGEAARVPLARDEFLLVDTGGSFHGYQSDNTRTWVPEGRAGVERTRGWYAVRDAQLRAFDAIRPGLRCREIDSIARASLESAGFGPGYRAFTHRLGHGIGLEGHEQPYFDLGSEAVLAAGMTLSDEPGIYLYGDYGVRLEDIVAVTADGAESFGAWQAGPTSPAPAGV